MKKFGNLKGKFLSKLTSLYGEKKLNEAKSIIKAIKDNKDLREMYLLYEDVETKFIEDKNVATFYVEELSKSLKGKNKELKKLYESLDKLIGKIDGEPAEIYDALDILAEEDSLLNIENKLKAKVKLVEHVVTKKKKEEKSSVFTENHNLLATLLAHGYNSKFGDVLSEDEKKKLKEINSMSQEELNEKCNSLKEDVLGRIETVLSESTDDGLNKKLSQVKDEVNNTKTSKYNYYKLIELKESL